MLRRIIAIGFVFGCISVGWVVLGGVTAERSYTQDEKLENAVWQLWGSPQFQTAPTVSYQTIETKEVTRNLGTSVFTELQKVPEQHPVPLEGSNIEVHLNLEHRRKGLIWYSTYKVGFESLYRVINRTPKEREFRFSFELPHQGAVYDDFHFRVDGQEIDDIRLESGKLSWKVKLIPGQGKDLQVSYRTQGVGLWVYRFGSNVSQVKNFRLSMRTDFADIDFPVPSMSPTAKEETETGWKLVWQYSKLLSGVQLGMLMPRKLNPGPWVSQITFFAPVSLFFFFFLMLIFTTVKEIKIHPMNYFFVGAAFFSFHLLLAYLVDHISIHLAFLVCSLVSIFLVISYMRLVVGVRFALLHVGISQFVYLVGFSYTFFFAGATGLTVTIMCIVTLFVVMQYTGRLDWEKVFRDAGDRLQRSTG